MLLLNSFNLRVKIVGGKEMKISWAEHSKIDGSDLIFAFSSDFFRFNYSGIFRLTVINLPRLNFSLELVRNKILLGLCNIFFNSAAFPNRTFFR